MVSERVTSWWIQNVPAILWTTDPELTITVSQGGGLSDLGLAPDQLTGTWLADQLGPEAPESVPLTAHRRALLGEVATYEHRWQGHTYRTRVEALPAPSGAVESCMGVAGAEASRNRGSRPSVRACAKRSGVLSHFA
jgi:PAS domain-containing protein